MEYLQKIRGWIKWKIKNGISLKTVIISIIVIAILIGISNSSGKRKLDNDEMITFGSLAVAVTHSAVDGTGTISRIEFDNIGKMLKKINSKNQWFSGATTTYYGLDTKTSDGFIIQVTDGNYVATFTMEYEYPDRSMSDYILVEYTFEQGSIKGYKFVVE